MPLTSIRKSGSCTTSANVFPTGVGIHMGHVLQETDFSAARTVQAAKLGELGFVPVCVAPGEQNKGHSHTLVEEVLIVKSGEGQIQIENETYDLCAGSVAMVPAGEFHALCNTGKRHLEGVILFNSNVDRDQVELKTRKQHFRLYGDHDG